jgi:beta-aspartyl-peptidase (threonine type)
MEPVLAVHGGAGRWRRLEEGERERVFKALRDAVEGGLRAVASGGAVDAVVEAVRVLEDSGLFDAGVGSVYSISGRVQMDAGVMDGKTGRRGPWRRWRA